jgi:hypothetical protein
VIFVFAHFISLSVFVNVQPPLDIRNGIGRSTTATCSRVYIPAGPQLPTAVADLNMIANFLYHGRYPTVSSLLADCPPVPVGSTDVFASAAGIGGDSKRRKMASEIDDQPRKAKSTKVAAAGDEDDDNDDDDDIAPLPSASALAAASGDTNSGYVLPSAALFAKMSAEEQSNRILHMLGKIMLRRSSSDVHTQLMGKRPDHLVSVGLVDSQKQHYRTILLREYPRLLKLDKLQHFELALLFDLLLLLKAGAFSIGTLPVGAVLSIDDTAASTSSSSTATQGPSVQSSAAKKILKGSGKLQYVILLLRKLLATHARVVLATQTPSILQLLQHALPNAFGLTCVCLDGDENNVQIDPRSRLRQWQQSAATASSDVAASASVALPAIALCLSKTAALLLPCLNVDAIVFLDPDIWHESPSLPSPFFGYHLLPAHLMSRLQVYRMVSEHTHEPLMQQMTMEKLQLQFQQSLPWLPLPFQSKFHPLCSSCLDAAAICMVPGNRSSAVKTMGHACAVTTAKCGCLVCHSLPSSALVKSASHILAMSESSTSARLAMDTGDGKDVAAGADRTRSHGWPGLSLSWNELCTVVRGGLNRFGLGLGLAQDQDPKTSFADFWEQTFGSFYRQSVGCNQNTSAVLFTPLTILWAMYPSHAFEHAYLRHSPLHAVYASIAGTSNIRPMATIYHRGARYFDMCVEKVGKCVVQL